jgi:hypothetical protein
MDFECPACAVMRLETPSYVTTLYPWDYIPEHLLDNKERGHRLVDFTMAADKADNYNPELRAKILAGLNLVE